MLTIGSVSESACTRCLCFENIARTHVKMCRRYAMMRLLTALEERGFVKDHRMPRAELPTNLAYMKGEIDRHVATIVRAAGAGLLCNIGPFAVPQRHKARGAVVAAAQPLATTAPAMVSYSLWAGMDRRQIRTLHVMRGGASPTASMLGGWKDAVHVLQVEGRDGRVCLEAAEIMYDVRQRLHEQGKDVTDMSNFKTPLCAYLREDTCASLTDSQPVRWVLAKKGVTQPVATREDRVRLADDVINAATGEGPPLVLRLEMPTGGAGDVEDAFRHGAFAVSEGKQIKLHWAQEATILGEARRQGWVKLGERVHPLLVFHDAQHAEACKGYVMMRLLTALEERGVAAAYYAPNDELPTNLAYMKGEIDRYVAAIARAAGAGPLCNIGPFAVPRWARNAPRAPAAGERVRTPRAVPPPPVPKALPPPPTVATTTPDAAPVPAVPPAAGKAEQQQLQLREVAMGFGKYAGKRPSAVLDDDPAYAAWVMAVADEHRRMTADPTYAAWVLRAGEVFRVMTRPGPRA